MESDNEECQLYDPDCVHHNNCPLYQNCPFDIRKNFNTFWRAYATMFVMITDSAWPDLMYAGMRHYKMALAGRWLGLTAAETV